MNLLTSSPSSPAIAPISPWLEMGANEALWLEQKTSFKSIAKKMVDDPSAMLSDLVDHAEAKQCAEGATSKLNNAKIGCFGIRVHRDGSYPKSLRDAEHPVELLYFQGDWGLAKRPSIAVIGSRTPSPEGIRRAKRLARVLVEHNYVVVSGLAAGIDTAAHEEAIRCQGNTIAVVGTPLGVSYPPQNRELQETIAKEHLVVSQVPILRYSRQGPTHNRHFFPQRNITMSALTQATIIVEAADRSGTLIQARAALKQNRKLFILNSCFRASKITWPAIYEQNGAIRVKDIRTIWGELNSSA